MEAVCRHFHRHCLAHVTVPGHQLLHADTLYHHLIQMNAHFQTLAQETVLAQLLASAFPVNAVVCNSAVGALLCYLIEANVVLHRVAPTQGNALLVHLVLYHLAAVHAARILPVVKGLLQHFRETPAEDFLRLHLGLDIQPSYDFSKTEPPL